jgi:hypothetical protein
MPLRERNFNKNQYDKEIRELDIKVSAYNSYLSKCYEIKEGLESREAVEKYLNGKTKFVNPRISADAMGVLSIYEDIVQLEGIIEGINHSALIENTKGNNKPKSYKIDPSFREHLRKVHTVFYTAEQTKQLNALESLLEGLNSLDIPFKESVLYNSREKVWLWAKQHTDNSLVQERVRSIR